ncbi:CE1759 family FMN reductase [Psychromicrobium xiongbiense]|uniref:CE1759 family FMN reductase n=1 Tax=Psychromicrobium xiongbiense TaxID=3051184 RepID=UPI002555D395|nr:CE1759 family FMN reductase [Psychromicrobium sp. YIM S02556]
MSGLATERSIVVISAGLGAPSSSRLLADQMAAAASVAAAERGVAARLTVVELRDLAVDIAQYLVSGTAASALRDALRAVEQADGLIVVTPVYSASYSGLFKSFFDLIDPVSLHDVPVLLGATGGSMRHSLVLDHALRPLFSYLRAAITPTGIYAGPDDWAASDWAASSHGQSELDSELSQRVVRGAQEFAQAMAHRPVRSPRALLALPAAAAEPVEQPPARRQATERLSNGLQATA